MELIFDVVRVLGNVIARTLFANKLVEEDSILSDALGLFTLLVIFALGGWGLVSYFS